MPISSAITFAVFSLSPVSITTFIFFSFNFFTTSFAFSLTTSFTPINAINDFSFATNNKLFPLLLSSFSLSSFFKLIPFSFINFLFPIKYVLPFIIAVTPHPAIALKSSIFLSFGKSPAYFTIALAIGCSDLLSMIATS